MRSADRSADSAATAQIPPVRQLIYPRRRPDRVALADAHFRELPEEIFAVVCLVCLVAGAFLAGMQAERFTSTVCIYDGSEVIDALDW